MPPAHSNMKSLNTAHTEQRCLNDGKNQDKPLGGTE